MSRYRSDPESLDAEKPSPCTNFLHYSWKTVTCLFSHATLITMVVSYCVLGAFTFEALEADHEREVKKGIRKIRENTTFYLWNFTKYELRALKEDNFTPKALVYLKEFEGALLKAITKDGWDGVEEQEKVQWTSTGALFYSIVVITTIGYGHLTPKTTWGKVVTIFYAILGIPLMLLCLSNIGDVMATSFRFLYWRVCCYVCQKKPKKMKRARSIRVQPNRSDNRFVRSKSASIRRSMRTSGKSTDSGYGISETGPGYHSDTDLRYGNDTRENKALHKRGSSLPSRPNRFSTNRRSQTANHEVPLPGDFRSARGGSLDNKKSGKAPRDAAIDLDPALLDNTPVLCNKYVVGNDVIANNVPGITLRAEEGQGKRHPQGRRAVSVPKTSKYLEIPSIETPDYDVSDREDEHSLKSRPRIKPNSRSRSRSPMPISSPKMMTPLGYGHRNKYLDDPDSDDYDDYEYYEARGKPKKKHVPIWLCVLLVISYILAGAYLFKTSEQWDYLDAAYFCFITLTTIGFGDLVPAKGVSQDGYDATISIALCSLYLLFGISLLAMSFNLVQEEVISNVKSVAKTLGIIKSESDESEDED
ncbi:uncharacterized protein LOC132706131 isoform X2 [Cylas formicarius]|uniref:uncharacterized protein LOC132706131 isoform X2 n=1 Tax=Cylas formicarius TaxID=197179 RepID=UPI002958D886|nr:uncharacterized protein LOC132706131 isoform X2 [Cylas formicarius]